MLRFVCPAIDSATPLSELHGAHLVGAEGVPVRGEVRLADGQILCEPRTQDPVALSLLWTTPGFGSCQLQTTRLAHRAQPYILVLELARSQLMRITLKREEWGLFDYPGMEELAGEIQAARALFIQALEAVALPVEAARLGSAALLKALWVAERLSRFHAEVFLNRRLQNGGFGRCFLGVTAASPTSMPALLKPIGEVADFVRVPFIWRQVQPTESGLQYGAQEAWIKAAAAQRLQVQGGPLLNFGVQFVPDWMYIYENDFEAIFDQAREHVQRTVQRYARQVPAWIAASGLHADSVFNLTFDQVMELTRMALQVTKQCAPRSQVILDLTQPWGEYFARNQQTIPPLSYADLAIQNGLPIDAFGLQLVFGIGSDGYHLRDLFQISALIDRLANLGRPIHVTALAAPSAPVPGSTADWMTGGAWHEPWSETSQADWLSAVCEIVLSKPYVESVCLQALVDGPDSPIASGGLLRADLAPKRALGQLASLRRRLMSELPQ